MPVYVSAYAGTPPQPVAVTAAIAAGGDWRAWYLGKRVWRDRNTDDASGTDELALVWSNVSVSGTGIWFLANGPNDTVGAARRNAINTRLGTNFQSGVTLRQIIRHILRQLPGRFRQAPIRNDGMVEITLNGYSDVFNQDEDPVQALDPPMAASYPPYRVT